ncbi:MAG TPA: hypothetical protein EYG58_00005, partial [Nitrospirales bacterium]|nr:hypothetical protein [Nitrospirales bacterium]
MTILARVKKRGIWVVVLLGVAVGLLFLLRLQTQETSERPASTQPMQETIVRGVSVEATLQDIPQTIESTGVVIAETRAPSRPWVASASRCSFSFTPDNTSTMLLACRPS